MLTTLTSELLFWTVGTVAVMVRGSVSGARSVPLRVTVLTRLITAPVAAVLALTIVTTASTVIFGMEGF